MSPPPLKEPSKETQAALGMSSEGVSSESLSSQDLSSQSLSFQGLPSQGLSHPGHSLKIVNQPSVSMDDLMDYPPTLGESNPLSDSVNAPIRGSSKYLLSQTGIFEGIYPSDTFDHRAFFPESTVASFGGKQPLRTNSNLYRPFAIPEEVKIFQLDGPANDLEEIPKKRKARVTTSSKLKADFRVRRSERGAGIQPEYFGLDETSGLLQVRTPEVAGTQPERSLTSMFFLSQDVRDTKLADTYGGEDVKMSNPSATSPHVPQPLMARPIAALKRRTPSTASGVRSNGLQSNSSPLAALSGRVTRSRTATLRDVLDTGSPVPPSPLARPSSPHASETSPTHLAGTAAPVEPSGTSSPVEPAGTSALDANIAFARKQPRRVQAVQARNRIRDQIVEFNKPAGFDSRTSSQAPSNPNVGTPPKAKNEPKEPPTPSSDHKWPWEKSVKARLGSPSKKREWKEDYKQVLADIDAETLAAHDPDTVKAQKLMYERRAQRAMEFWPESNVRGAGDGDPERRVKARMAHILKIVEEENRLEERAEAKKAMEKTMRGDWPKSNERGAKDHERQRQLKQKIEIILSYIAEKNRLKEEREEEDASEAREQARRDVRIATLSPSGEPPQDAAAHDNAFRIRPGHPRFLNADSSCRQASATADLTSIPVKKLLRPCSRNNKASFSKVNNPRFVSGDRNGRRSAGFRISEQSPADSNLTAVLENAVSNDRQPPWVSDQSPRVRPPVVFGDMEYSGNQDSSPGINHQLPWVSNGWDWSLNSTRDSVNVQPPPSTTDAAPRATTTLATTPPTTPLFLQQQH